MYVNNQAGIKPLCYLFRLKIDIHEVINKSDYLNKLLDLSGFEEFTFSKASSAFSKKTSLL